MLTLHGLKTCDTCRRALRELKASGHPAALVDVREAPLDSATRARFAAAFGETLVNRASATWRALPEDERAGAPEDLIARHPAVMKRPVIARGDDLWLGWSAEVRAELLD